MAVRTTTLANGLRIVTEEMPHLETVTVGLWADVGSRHETEELNGISHMLEHMAFKGTERRSALDIVEEVEDVGGYLNAYTSREHTTYYVRLLKEDLGLGIDVLADILQHSAFSSEELERERSVILQEIGQANDTPDDLVLDMMQEAAFPGQALGRSILGTRERVRRFQRDTLQNYMQQNYAAENMVAVAVGAVDHDYFVEMIDRQFRSLPGSRNLTMEPASYIGGDLCLEKDLEQVNVVLGFRGVTYHDPDYYTYQVLSMLLGGGMSSRLFQEVREKRGLVYSIYSFAASYVDDGVFGIHAGTGPDQVTELLPVIADELLGLATKVTDEEIRRAAAQIKAGILMSMESSTSRMDQLGRQFLIFNREVPIAELVTAIEAVDRTAIVRAVDRMLASRPTVAAVGPLAHMDTVDRLASRFGRD
ncbi:MAG: peptidase M16 [Kordiimonas sp.]|nr:peptidase M16 [Kordiimonas sp.]|tara:strand:- start:5631 stop:6893 length:1263 start_codon:yes stop_codon:yes gene_type:complete